uniref:Potassium channel domain-containing protein n=2 Tax=Wuchereria bancrofti TaxID=6293 RepID=A0AAF5PM41_WUCBA
MTHEGQELNETKEIERLYYKLNKPRSRSRLCFLLYLFIIPLFIIIGGVTFSLSELVASQEAETGNAQIESCHRKKLFELLPTETFVFGNAALYSFGVYTTIGYGNLFPHTVQGRILTVVYAVIGIPLNVAFISDLGELISRTVQRALHCFQRRILNKTTEDPCIEYKKFLLIVLIAFLLTPIIAIIVMEAERSRNWNYIDSLYYTFTTSTLIGLGDFTPQSSYIQFFVLMPLFFIVETLLALALGFITHLYRYESVILFKLIKHKISRFFLHRRLQLIKNTLQGEDLRSLQEFTKLNTENDTTNDALSVDANIDNAIAKLSAREMRMDEKIDREIQMLEAVPSQIDLGILNAQMKNDNEDKQKFRHTMKNWLSHKENEDMK